MITLKPFDRADYDAFAGVESKNPLIAYIADDLVMIVDDKQVVLYETIEPADNFGEGYTLHRSFNQKSCIAAELAATALLNAYNVMDRKQFLLLFNAILNASEQHVVEC